jgi:Class III cytochrome C family
MRVSKLSAAWLGVLAAAALCCVAHAQTAPTNSIILKGAPMGAVKFDHTSHLKVAGKCNVCHHASKPQKALKSPQEACTDCHTNPATPPVTTKLQAAFHNPSATSGLCIDCHKTEDANGKAAPVKCADCHKKDNA